MQKEPFGSLLLVALKSSRLFVRTNLFKCFGFNLANTFSSNAKLLPYLLKRVVHAIKKSMAHLKNLALFWRKVVENIPNLLGQNAL